ncbi:exodeoxyribonuclease VII large subunit [Mangrovactinospora gilvigrisea]|uniref:Exodeoxyribonuclease 7 large subunit n=1 Tax=Mangrovactinospora gilvigrisea TaxID=1428644 RepID=A0A1J7CBA4_9ACTN|nr:exodeoxyribonuclease VII large subunit [Mangrovactinospora gilvigrisea]OIV38800.1 exodeoxyribonuclease VII large subunit [Mangrovactinospora gilvigrisea]
MANSTSPEEPMPVAEVTRRIGAWIDRLGEVWVEGQLVQISRRPGAGVVFMQLRDASANVSMTVTCFRAVFDAVADTVTEGTRVVVAARPNWYQGTGQLSLRAREIRPVGVGDLLARLERLRRRLAGEGLFDADRKRRPPFLPQLIGLVCGRASAAERDVLENARKRWPAVRFEVREVAVQGVHAVAEVIGALQELDAHPEVDVIVVARGGGSVEDLLPFSDEQLMRAVAAASTPVVSAIGHEPDAPLLDLVADVRASTPTDAAKRIVPDVGEELAGVAQARERARRAVAARIEREQAGLDGVRTRPVLAAPLRMVEEREAEVRGFVERARRVFDHRLERAASELEHVRARVLALSPAATLKRGYAVLQAEDGGVVRAADEVAVGDALRARVAEGEFKVKVEGK